MIDLSKYYDYIEGDISFDYAHDLIKYLNGIEYSELTEEEHLIIQVELNTKIRLEPDRINSVFAKNKDEVILYLKERSDQTNNPLLKAQYSQFLYVLTKDNRYAKISIDNYHIIVEHYYKNEVEEGYPLYYARTLKQTISLVERTKHKVIKTKNFIIEHLRSENASQQSKTKILEQLKSCKLFKAVEINFIPQLCLDMANSDKTYYLIKSDLETGLFFALKDMTSHKALIPEIYELLGDNEKNQIKHYDGKDENIMIPHYNQATYKKMMEYYKRAKNQGKLNNSTKLYNDNKKNLRLLKISHRIAASSQIQPSLDELFQSIVSAPTQAIVFDLCLGKNILFPTHDMLEKHVADNVNADLFKYLPPVHIDHNGNQRQIDVEDHLKYFMYDTWLHNYIQFTYDIILSCVDSKKLSYTEVKKVLLQSTFFGHELIVSRVNGQKLSYTFFNQIDIGLKSFFKECELLIQGKQCDWRVSIDIMALKFEGILRDIIGLQSGVITKVDKDGNTVDLLLDDLLRSEAFKAVFDKDDEDLFFYTFTNKGKNIRNCVAHGFYKPQDYTFYKAVLVLLSVFRLAKFVPNE